METTIYRNPRVVEITRGWNFSYKVSQYHDQYTLIISLIYLTFYITIPDFMKGNYDFNNWDRSWGIYWFEKSINFCWGNEHRSWRMPWDWEHVRHEVLFPDGTFRKPVGDSLDTDDGRLVGVYPFTYTLKNGTVQNRTGTVYTEEREWRMRWFQWLPWPNLIRRAIWVSFDGEVGERTGSWKGGTIGCGYDCLPGETMEETFRRMESEREFS